MNVSCPAGWEGRPSMKMVEKCLASSNLLLYKNLNQQLLHQSIVCIHTPLDC